MTSYHISSDYISFTMKSIHPIILHQWWSQKCSISIPLSSTPPINHNPIPNRIRIKSSAFPSHILSLFSNLPQKSRVHCAKISVYKATVHTVQSASSLMDLQSSDVMQLRTRVTKPNLVSVSWKKNTVFMDIAAISYTKNKDRKNI